MRAANISDFRENIKSYLDEVEENADLLIVTRPKSRGFVVMSLDEFESWRETMYLLSSPANAERLRRSMSQLEAGQFQSRELIDPTATETT